MGKGRWAGPNPNPELSLNTEAGGGSSSGPVPVQTCLPLRLPSVEGTLGTPCLSACRWGRSS